MKEKGQPTTPYWKVIDASRKAKGLTWDALSQHVSILRNTLAIAKSKGRCMDLEETIRIASVLDLSLDILYWDDKASIPHTYSNKLQDISFPEDSSISARFWILVDILRRDIRMSWDVISEKSGIGRSTLSTAKSYNRTLPFDKDCRIIEVLGFSMDDVLSILQNNGNLPEDNSLEARFARLTTDRQRIISNLIDSLLEEQEQK